MRIARLKRLIKEARHQQACHIAVAVEVLTSNAYALGKASADVEAAMSAAHHAQDVVDEYLLALADQLRPGNRTWP
jgi:hypothetical protein